MELYSFIIRITFATLEKQQLAFMSLIKVEVMNKISQFTSLDMQFKTKNSILPNI